MKKATAEIRGLTVYSQSRCHATEKKPKESPDAYEQRTWIEKGHWDQNGQLFIPGVAFKNAIAEAAKYLGETVPGKGKSTYTKHFEAGVSVAPDRLNCPVFTSDGKPVSRDDRSTYTGDTLHVPSNGVRGNGTRVFKTFPTALVGWRTTVEFWIYDDMLTEDVFLRYLKQSGLLIGVGSFRVRNNGPRGQFNVDSFSWDDDFKYLGV
jgi:hypothetical protein